MTFAGGLSIQVTQLTVILKSKCCSASNITVTKNDGTASATIGTLLAAAGGTTVTNNGGTVTIGTIKFDTTSTSLSVTGTVGVTNIELVPPATANGGSTGFSLTGITSGTLSVDASNLSLIAGESITLLTMADGVPAAWGNLTFGAYKTAINGNNLLLQIGTPTITANPASLSFGNVTINTTSAARTVNISSADLTGNITYVKEGADEGAFTITETTWNAATGGTLSVTFNPTAARAYSASIKLSSPGATDVVVQLSGTGTSGGSPGPNPPPNPPSGITGLPDSYSLIVGQSVSFAPAPAGGTWQYDSDMLSMQQDGGTVTFTALKTGNTTVTYTVNGVSRTVSITINAATIPQTGDMNDPLPFALLALAGLAGIGAVLLYKKRKSHA